MRLQGSLPVLITPFSQDYTIDIEGVRANVDRMIDSHVHGLVVPGGTGETPHLSITEYQNLIKAVVDQVNGRIPVIASPIYVRESDVIAQSKFSEDIGVDALLVLPPYYYGLSKHEIIDFYRTVASSVNIPIMIYHNPGPIDMTMEPMLIAQIARASPLIRYIKDSTTDVRRIQRILSYSEHKIGVFTGIDEMVFPGFALGSSGSVNTASNLIPAEFTLMCEYALEKRNFEESRKIYLRLLPLFWFLASTGPRMIPVIKAGVTMLGGVGGKPRPPFHPVTSEELNQLTSILHKIGVPIPG
ncbi:MAG: dihydrodipicolinate synthase family protein [Candidatus Ranarchaeia archaeon]